MHELPLPSLIRDTNVSIVYSALRHDHPHSAYTDHVSERLPVRKSIPNSQFPGSKSFSTSDFDGKNTTQSDSGRRTNND